MKVAAVIAAAGAGLRMEAAMRKQYFTLGGIPVLARSLKLFTGHRAVTEVIAVIPPGEAEAVRVLLQPHLPSEQIKLVEGGATRQASVARGLALIAEDAELVCIHDAARPLASSDLLDRLIAAAARWGAAIPVLQPSDTIKEVDREDFVVKTLQRDKLRLVQTPQVFRLDLILEAYREAEKAGLTATDDASLIEMIEKPVKTLPGEAGNIKITKPDDFLVAALLLEGAGEK